MHRRTSLNSSFAAATFVAAALLFTGVACDKSDSQTLDSGAAKPGAGAVSGDLSPARADSRDVVTNAPAAGSVDGLPASPPSVDVEGLKREVAKHRGKVVLVDFWATWCVPCVEKLPHVADMSHKYAQRGLAVVTVSFDSARDWKKAVATLRRAKATGPALLMDDRDQQNATVDWLGHDWRSELPAQFIFDRQGNVQSAYLADQPEGAPSLDELVERALGTQQ